MPDRDVTARPALPTAEIAALEHHADASWPALETVDVRGWQLRHLGGDDNTRPNSARPPLDPPPGGEELATDLAMVEDFYRTRGTPVAVQVIVGVTDDLARLLAGRGYTFAVPSDVFTGDVPELADAPQRGRPPGSRIGCPPTAEWLEAWQAVTAEDEQRTEILERSLNLVEMSARGVTVHVDGVPAAAGRGTVSGGLLGIFNCATAAEFRGQGLIGAVVRELAAWGRSLGATRSYLQVSGLNESAKRAYRRAGYRPTYAYGYMRKETSSDR
jgi:GNAT superfamily N-acetyltransferase